MGRTLQRNYPNTFRAIHHYNGDPRIVETARVHRQRKSHHVGERHASEGLDECRGNITVTERRRNAITVGRHRNIAAEECCRNVTVAERHRRKRSQPCCA